MSVAVVAGADCSFSLSCSGFGLEVSQPRFWMFESLYPLRPPPQVPDSCRRLFLLSPALAPKMMAAWISFVQTGP